VVGVFMDVDHLLDYARLFPSRPLLLDVFKDMVAHMRPGERIYLVLHAYEVATLIWLAVSALGHPFAGTVVATSMFLHLLIDQCTNETAPLAYFLCYRVSKGFQVEHIFPRVNRRQ